LGGVFIQGPSSGSTNALMYDLILIDTEDAKCLDGSSPAIYFR